MWCDRCAENDQASLGTDEHGLTCGYLVLCERCAGDIRDSQEWEASLQPAPALAQRDAGYRLTRSRGLRRGGYDRYADR